MSTGVCAMNQRKQERRQRAFQRLGSQLESGVKTLGPLTDADKARIIREREALRLKGA